MESTASSDVIFFHQPLNCSQGIGYQCEGDIYAALKNCPFKGILVEMTYIKTDSNVH